MPANTHSECPAVDTVIEQTKIPTQTQTNKPTQIKVHHIRSCVLQKHVLVAFFLKFVFLQITSSSQMLFSFFFFFLCLVYFFFVFIVD